MKFLLALFLLALSSPTMATTFWIEEPTHNTNGTPLNGTLETLVINCQGLDNPGSFNVVGIPASPDGGLKASYTVNFTVSYTGTYRCTAYAVNVAGTFSGPSPSIDVYLEGPFRIGWDTARSVAGPVPESPRALVSE